MADHKYHKGAKMPKPTVPMPMSHRRMSETEHKKAMTEAQKGKPAKKK